MLPAEVSNLVDKMLQKRLYAVFSTMVQPIEALKPHLADHLRYLIALEQRGILFASGPYFNPQGAIEGSSLTILRAASFEAAQAIAAEDPLHVQGIRQFEIKGWQINEGSYTVTVRYSDQTYSLD